MDDQEPKLAPSKKRHLGDVLQSTRKLNGKNTPNRSLTWNLKMAAWNRRFLLETIILGSMLNLVIQSVTFWDGEWNRDPNSRGCWWPPTIGDEKGTAWITWPPKFNLFAPQKMMVEKMFFSSWDGLILKGRAVKLPGSMRGLPGSSH